MHASKPLLVLIFGACLQMDVLVFVHHRDLSWRAEEQQVSASWMG